MNERIRKACLGAIVGHTLGAPFKGRNGFTRVTFYEPIPKRMVACPALDAWVAMADSATKLTSPTEIQDVLFENWAYREGTSAFGAANFGKGLRAPSSGSFSNPLSNGAESISRALFWGLVFPDQPAEAARWASFDAAYDRSGDAVRVASVIARMVSTARSGMTFAQLATAITQGVPADSAIVKALKIVVQWIGQPDAVRSTVSRVQQDLGIVDPFDAVLSISVVMASLANAKDAPGALCAAVGCGGASDQNGLVTGVISSLLWDGISEEWTSVLGTSYVAGHGLRIVVPPKEIEGFVALVEGAKVAFSGPEVAEIPMPVPSDSVAQTVSEGVTPAFEPAPSPSVVTEETTVVQNSDPPTEVPALTLVESTPVPEAPALPAEPPALPPLAGLPSNSASAAWDVEGLRVEWQYLDGPIVHEGQKWQAAVRFVNSSVEPVDVEAKVTAPSQWEVATRLSSFRLAPGESAVHGVIVRPVGIENLKPLKLKINGTSFKIGVLAPPKWFVAGPFVNDDGTAFTKEFPQERVQSQNDHFAGRSGMTVKWTELQGEGRSFDVEPLFQDGPGVVFLCARLVMAKAGSYRIVAAGSPGVVVRVDGNLLVRYQDTHVPVPRDQAPYSAPFAAAEEVSVVIKLIRDRVPVAPLTLYFLDEQGNVVDPVEFKPLPE